MAKLTASTYTMRCKATCLEAGSNIFPAPTAGTGYSLSIRYQCSFLSGGDEDQMAGFCIHVVPPSPSMRQQKETKQLKRSWLKLKRRTCYSHMWELKDFGTFLGLFSLMEHAPRHVTVRCLGLTNSGCWFTLPVWRHICL